MFRARRRERRPFSGRVVVLLFLVLAGGEGQIEVRAGAWAEAASARGLSDVL